MLMQPLGQEQFGLKSGDSISEHGSELQTANRTESAFAAASASTAAAEPDSNFNAENPKTPGRKVFSSFRFFAGEQSELCFPEKRWSQKKSDYLLKSSTKLSFPLDCTFPRRAGIGFAESRIASFTSA